MLPADQAQRTLYSVSVVTVGLFLAASCVVVLAWNRFFPRVPWRYALLFISIVTTYESPTLLTTRVDLPANLAFVAYPWQATGAAPVKANTGIVFTQIAPWTAAARRALADGELPLWNRDTAAGNPLLANQQTAIFHPFTLLGLLLPLGKAFTLTACMRLFSVLFFTFVLLRAWNLSPGASVFGAVAFTFSSFHIVWLLFPLGLASMALPACLCGALYLIRDPRPASYVFLVIALSSAVLGGHPESAMWVWLLTAVFTLYVARMYAFKAAIAHVGVAASAFIVAMMVTAFFWYPTLVVLQDTQRFQAMSSREANPTQHGLSYEWLSPLIAQNVLGSPMDGSYVPPRGAHAAVLNDYGEVASAYAGLLTLGLAIGAPFLVRRRPFWFAAGVAVFAFCSIAEVPVWRDALRSIPLAGISLHQRLRLFWNLGVCVLAALTVDEIGTAPRKRQLVVSLSAAALGFCLVYALRHVMPTGGLAIAQAAVPLLALGAFVLLLLRYPRLIPAAAVALVFMDLLVATWHYNPPARPRDTYPTTGAIRFLLQQQQPFRFAALGWSFLPETPSYYGLEDVKVTDPVQNSRYMRLFKGYFNVDPGAYDLLIRDISQPFADYLNVRFFYAPPGVDVNDARLVERYRGEDGRIFENTRVLPRYFFVNSFRVEPNFDQVVWESRSITDFRSMALVDHIPAQVSRVAPELRPDTGLPAGDLTLKHYGPNGATLAVYSAGWNLLVTSDTNWRGWRAYFNGKRLPTVIVNGAFVGCFVPPGNGNLVLRYRPAAFDDGIRAGVVGLALLLIASSWWAVRRTRQPA